MKQLKITNAGLVQSLLATLGREAAIKACRANLWFGIAAEIEAAAPVERLLIDFNAVF